MSTLILNENSEDNNNVDLRQLIGCDGRLIVFNASLTYECPIADGGEVREDVTEKLQQFVDKPMSDKATLRDEVWLAHFPSGCTPGTGKLTILYMCAGMAPPVVVIPMWAAWLVMILGVVLLSVGSGLVGARVTVAGGSVLLIIGIIMFIVGALYVANGGHALT